MRIGFEGVVMLAAASLSAGLFLAGCGDDHQSTPSIVNTSVAQTPSVSMSPQPDRDRDFLPDTLDPYPDDPQNRPKATVAISCYMDESFEQSQYFAVTTDGIGRPDFTAAWSAKPRSCTLGSSVAPVTTIEKTAYETSNYGDGDISGLYNICIEVNPTDTYVEPGFAMSPGQIAEVSGALILCPKHPFAKQWRQAIQRGKDEASLAAAGKLFGSGTFLVGKEIKAGTYVVTDVEGCYWERQNKSGGTIDNDFINSARRVQVTIRPRDYAFSSSRCGEWKPTS
jgi:hypothetical protein